MQQEDATAPTDVRDSVWVFVTLAGVSASLTAVYLGMRAVMEIGGTCAEGGPFVPVRPCPEGVPGLMIGGIWAGLIFAGLYVWRAMRAGAISFAGFLWPALFLSLGWNFLEFGLRPPGDQGTAWGWIVCAVVFLLMGGAPLLVAVPAFAGRVLGRDPSQSGLSGRLTGGSLRTAAAAASAFRRSTPREADLVSRLERLDALHRSGALDDREFEAAKRALLGDLG
jgi:hypothetical protein